MVDPKDLIAARCHFGHLKRKWNPAMAPYIYQDGKKSAFHIIDMYKTAAKLDEACAAIKQIAKSGKRVLFVATKKQAKDIVAEKAATVQMPYVTERWAGGMLTNFPTIRKAVKKMTNLEKMAADGTFDNVSKREKLQIERNTEKLKKNLGSISDLVRLPAALFVVDTVKENIAVKEAKKLGIPVFGIVDTNGDPNQVDFVIPANADAKESIEIIVNNVVASISDGLQERKVEKEAEVQEDEKAEAPVQKKTRATRRRKAETADSESSETAATETSAE
ncbi:MAG: 30S ribosomal protein S2 [Paludibacteraceae bacterium]|nr:30S ribosomal protein S2 [Paludibacteraceae bacterium]